MDTFEEIGRRIRQARSELGLLQADLGQLLTRQRSHAAISDIERGKTKLDIDELTEFARVLRKPLAYFTEPLEVEQLSRSSQTPTVVYRRSERAVSDRQRQEATRSIEAFMQQARSRARAKGDAG